MRRPGYALFLLALIIAPATLHSSDVRDETTVILAEDPLKVKPSAIAPADRVAVFAELRAAIGPDKAGWRHNVVLSRLMNVGDTNTIQEVVEYHFRSKRGVHLRMAEYWEKCSHPYAIERIAEYLNSADRADNIAGVQSIGDDVEGLSRSTEAARVICRIIKNSDVFPPAVKAWAESLTQGNWVEGRDWAEASKNGQKWETLRRAVRQWWRENKAHLLAEEYSQVKVPEQGIGVRSEWR